MADGRGLPLLSGPPPQLESTLAGTGCRKCGKDFNMFLNRSRKCNHCGYFYCHTCSDYQALMPRTGQESGYDVMNVCAYCIEFLTITAGGRGHLKTLTPAKLRKYASVYNIPIDRAVEKDDLIDAIMSGRLGNGCLPRENENYYRKYSVPDRSGGPRSRGLFSRSQSSTNEPPNPPPRPPSQRPAYHFPRPDLAPDDVPQQQYAPPPGPPPHHYHSSPTPPRPQYYTQPPQPPPPPPHRPYEYRAQPPPPPQRHHYHNAEQSHTPPSNTPYFNPPPPPPTRNPYPQRQQGQSSGPHQHPPASHSPLNTNTNTSTRSNSSQSPPRPRAASSVPPPTLDELLAMSPAATAALSVGTLKAILFKNHVNAGPVLEKGELVERVRVLVEDEQRERARQAVAEEQEERERIEQQRAMMEERESTLREREARARAEAEAAVGADKGEEAGTPPQSTSPSPPPLSAKAADGERMGLCVVCQDEEANIAIVDCGHLAMCRGCSDLIMASSKECPLCRTRIVTEARLLRIFKT